MFDVITIGSATVDVFAKTHSELVKIKTPKTEETLICYPSGAKILIKDLQFMTGGGGTNTAVAFSRLGLKTGYLGHLGKGENGDKIISMFKKEKIKFLGTRGNEMTNYSMVLDSIEHDRTILAYKEASQKLSYEKINKSTLKTKWFYISSTLGQTFKTTEKLVSFAVKNGIKIAFNPSNYQAEKGAKYLKKILDNTNLLVLNKEEAELLLGRRYGTDLNELLEGSHELGPKIVVITDGKEGAYCSDGKKKLKVIPRKINILETTGAGDAFASSFLSGLIKKKDIKFALQMAVVNAQSVIQNYGAKNILLNWKQAIKEMKLRPRKIIGFK
ncbi:carbohydrate kinase family protein [Nanoarchaeota archaeon]